VFTSEIEQLSRDTAQAGLGAGSVYSRPLQ